MGNWDILKLKEKQKRKEREKWNRLYLTYIMDTVLPELQNGKQWHLYDTYSVFFMEDTTEQVSVYQKKVAQYLADMLDSMGTRRMFEMEKEFRQSDWYYDRVNYNYDWRQVDVSREQFPALDDREYAAILKFGTFHLNGYYRQNCMERLVEFEGSLPFLALRLNDWVQPIREVAFFLVKKKICICGMDELFRTIPCLNKVKHSQRRSQEVLQELEALVQKCLSEKVAQIDLEQIKSYEASVRNAIYRLVSDNPILELEQLNALLEQERSSYGEMILIQGIFKNYDSDSLLFGQYLDARCALVRMCALEYWYGKIRDSWEGLKKMLLDKSGRIRNYASGILIQHGGFSVYDFYVEQVSKKPTAVGILGVGEFGTSTDIDMIRPFLENTQENLAAAAMTAIGKLAGDTLRGLYWDYLFDQRLCVSKRAYRNIRTWNIHYGVKTLYEAYLRYPDTEIGNLLIRLMLQEDSWERLPYLLRLYNMEDMNLRDSIRKKIAQRSMYAAIGKDKKAEIQQILQEKENELPMRLRQEIMLDLKHR